MTALRAGLAFLFCCGATALALFFLSVFGVDWSRQAVLIALVVVVPGSIFLARKAQALPAHSKALRAYTAAAFVIDVVIVAAIVGYAIFATWAPPFEWDFFGIWGLKARSFYEAGGIEWRSVAIELSHPDYPPLMPLLFDAVAILRGGWDDRWFGLLYVAMCASVVLIARGITLVETQSHTKSALVALAVLFPALNLWIGLAEGAVMAFGTAGLLLIRRGLAISRNDLTMMGATFLGFAAWSKNEGLALIVVSIVAAILVTRKVAALWPAVVIPLPWLIARTMHRVPTDFLQGDVIGRVTYHAKHFGSVVSAFARFPPDRPVFWLTAIAILLIYWRDALTRERFLTISVILQLTLLAGQVLATQWNIEAHIELSWNRLPYQIAPALAFLCAMLLVDQRRRSSAAAIPSAT